MRGMRGMRGVPANFSLPVDPKNRASHFPSAVVPNIIPRLWPDASLSLFFTKLFHFFPSNCFPFFSEQDFFPCSHCSLDLYLVPLQPVAPERCGVGGRAQPPPPVCLFRTFCWVEAHQNIFSTPLCLFFSGLQVYSSPLQLVLWPQKIKPHVDRFLLKKPLFLRVVGRKGFFCGSPSNDPTMMKIG